MVHMPVETMLHLEIDAGELTIGSLVARLEAVVAYARSKGAPDKAVVRLHVSPQYDHSSGTIEPNPRPHLADVVWLEPSP